MIAFRRTRWVAAGAIVIALTTSSVLKLLAWERVGGWPRVGGCLEIGIAVALCVPRCRVVALRLLAFGLAGASLASVSLIVAGRSSESCGCLGRVDMSRGHALVGQGVLLAAAVLAMGGKVAVRASSTSG